jgi:hypothetical protein
MVPQKEEIMNPHQSRPQTLPEHSLLKLTIAGAMGSILGSLLLESMREEVPLMGWSLFGFLIIGYSLLNQHPLTAKKLNSLKNERPKV